MTNQQQVLTNLDVALVQTRLALIAFCDNGDLPAVKRTLERIDELLDQRSVFTHAVRS